ncbi:hypothetical protein H6768_01515 [Candidatus Peribacteria bacterium]|nr:hypothetical protein [Candidatus Peribacteria bacterium]
MALQKIGRFLILFFAAMLPWSVIVSVAGVERLDISITRFSKEIILLVFSFVLIADMWRKKYRPTFDILDGAIVCYVIALL